MQGLLPLTTRRPDVTRSRLALPVPRRRLAYAAPLALCAALLSCGPQSRPTADLVVTSFSPTEHSRASEEPVQIRFDRPVVASSEVGPPLAAAPVHIQPPMAARAHWLDRQTLVLTPQAPLRPSTTYHVALTGALAERTGGFSHRFVHRPLVIEGVRGMDLTQLTTRPTLPIRFDQPVRPGDVVAHCRILDADVDADPASRDIALELAPATATPEATAEATAETTPGAANVQPMDIAVVPARALAQGHDYELVCKDLAGAGGDTPLSTPYVLALRTHDTFFVSSAQPQGRDVTTDQLEIALTFSTPVTLDAVRAHVRATPDIPGLEHGWLDNTGTIYKTTVDLETTTRYELTLAEGITDIHGQRPSRPLEHVFTTGNARPTLSMETGIYAVEPTMQGYPVWTRNVRDFDITCAAVPRQRIVSLLTSDMDYDPWYNAQLGKVTNTVDWAAHGLQQKQTRVAIDVVEDKWHLDYLGLGEMCGGKGTRGVFLAEVQSRDVQPDPDRPWRYRPVRRVLANVTDMGVLLKVGPASGLVWVSSIATGKPLPGARVTLYSPQGRRVHRGRTDQDGLLRIPGSSTLLRQPESLEGGEIYSYRSQRLIALVEREGELAVVDGNWANGIQAWNFGVREDRRGGETRIRGMIQSDRGIYRPGETVHFKGLVREIAEGQPPAVPRRRRIHVRVEDSRGQSLLDDKLPVSAFGGFAMDLPLTAEANLGDYHVTATIQDQTFRERFMVEEFRPVSFEVGLETTARHGRLGEKLRFDVDAQYLFGAPVAGASVEWNVQRRPHTVSFAAHPQYTFADHAARGYDYYLYGYQDTYLSHVSDGTGKTDGRGAFRIEVLDEQSVPQDGEAAALDGPQDYLVSATVRDQTDQTVSARKVVTAHKTDFYLGLHTQEFVQAVGMPFAVNTLAITPAGERVATRATLRFIRESYHCEYEGTYRVWRTCKPRHHVALERKIDIPRTGTGTERIMPEKPGEYIVRVTATDSRGNEVTSAGRIWVLGKGEAFWSGDESARMALVASKHRYQPGETARLVPRADMKDATALVTVERDGIIDAFVKPMKSSAEGIEIDLTEAHAPNVFASVVMVSGRSGKGDRNRPQFKMGVVELEVSSEQHRLRVDVTTERASYQPGEQVSGVIRVTAAGAPVRAEVSLSAADEGVLQLIAYQTPDPMKAFYASWGLGVDASTSWNRIARLNAPAGADPDAGGDSGAGDTDRIRSNFVSSAFWAPSLLTDDSGEVRFSFAAPDNLTAFRLMAVAADRGTRFGSGDQRITVSKPLLAKPVLPRFLNTGDDAEVGVVVHNYTDKAGTALVTAKVEGARIATAKQRVAIAAGGSARVRFPVRAGTDQEAVFAFSARMGTHRDAVQVTVPVHRPLRIDRKTLASGDIGSRGSAQSSQVRVPLSWGADVLSGRSELTITIDRTGLGGLEPALRYLIKYPYGCLEQTLSRFVPLTKVEDLAASLGMKDLRGPKLASFLRAGVAKVIRHQHADGHFSLWPSGATYPHLTVYAIYGLSEARRAGVQVQGEVIDRGLRAIRTWANGRQVTPNGDGATMAMAAYVLAELGQPDPALVARLLQARRGLPRYGQAFLLRAMKRTGATQADIDTARDELVAAAVVRGDTAVISEIDIDLGYYMSSDVRSSAMVLSALLEVDPRHALIDKLAAGLEQTQQPGGGWRSTQDNVYSLVALADYARRASAGSTTVTISTVPPGAAASAGGAGGKSKRLARRRLDGAEVLVLRQPLSQASQGTLRIEVSDRARYAVRLTEARADLGAVAEDQGFQVVRQYLDPDTDGALANIEAGDLVKVRVRVTSPVARRYVAVEDPLPAGFEAVNTRLATSEQSSGRSRSRWGWTHSELRDDRVLGFIDNMRAGTMTMEYLARATIPGVFVAPPARAEEMYAPEHYGRTPAANIQVQVQ